MIANERLRVVQRPGEQVDVVRVADFPSTTAAFRCNPRSVARFIGVPENAALNSGGVMRAAVEVPGLRDYRRPDISAFGP